MFTCTLAQYVAYKTNVAQQFTPQKHYRLPHPGQGILGPAPAIYASQPTPLPSAFSTMPLQDPTWHMDTCASSHLNFNASNLSIIFDKRLFPSVHVGDGKSIPVTNRGHGIIPSHHRPLHLHNVLVTPNIIKNLISVRQFTRDNNCTIEFDAFSFSVKDYLTRHILIRCDSSSDLYPVTKPLTSPIAFLSTSASTWHQRLGHPGDQVLRSLVSSHFISCNKEKSSHICHACQLGKHVELPFHSSDSIVEHCFDIIHSDLWTSLIISSSGIKLAFNSIDYLFGFSGLLLCHGKCYVWMIFRVKAKIVNQRMQTDHFASAPDVVRLIVVESRLPNNLFQTWRPSYGGWKEAESAAEKPAGGQGLGGSVMATSSKAHHLPILISATFSILIHLASHITTVYLPATINNSQLTVKKLDIEKKNNYTFLVVNSFEATRELFRPISNTGQTAWQQYGSLSRYKACLVANRNCQQLGVDYDETFSPIVKPATIHTILSLAASQQCHVHHLDVKNAFLDSTLSEIVYMHHLLVFEILGVLITTPVDTESKSVADGTPISDMTLYRSLAEALQYLTFTRPDLSYAIQQSWSSKRQYTVSRSSVEAEYRGVASVVAETSWLHNLLRELQSRLHSATIVYCDNVCGLFIFQSCATSTHEAY
ncbi:ribonuclease H-like domain-containing protein [Tanacetum coccineum]